MVTMLVANMYFIFVLDADGGLFAQEARASSQDSPPPYRQRFWGWSLKGLISSVWFSDKSGIGKYNLLIEEPLS